MNSHYSRHHVANLLETTTPTQLRKTSKNNLNIWQYSVLEYYLSALIKEKV